MRYLPLTLLPLVFLACADTLPVAPDVAPPLLKATFGEVVIEHTDNFQQYVKCANDGAGEVLHWFGTSRVTGRNVTSNSGNVLQLRDIEYLDGYTITGLTSGDAWTVSEARSHFTAHFQDNGNVVRTTTWIETYENQDGNRMLTRAMFHATFANGAWRVFRFGDIACSLK